MSPQCRFCGKGYEGEHGCSGDYGEYHIDKHGERRRTLPFRLPRIVLGRHGDVPVVYVPWDIGVQEEPTV